MKTLEKFIKSTFIGGLLVILPVCLVALVIVKGVAATKEVLAPVIEHLPSGLQFPNAFALVVLIGVCLGAGCWRRRAPDSTWAASSSAPFSIIFRGTRRSGVSFATS